jgi:hypothetical protein
MPAQTEYILQVQKIFASFQLKVNHRKAKHRSLLLHSIRRIIQRLHYGHIVGKPFINPRGHQAETSKEKM